MSKKVNGISSSWGLPKPDLRETNPEKGSFVHGKNQFAQQIEGGLPPGGTPGQVLTRTEEGYAWQDVTIPKEYGLVTYYGNERRLKIT